MVPPLFTFLLDVGDTEEWEECTVVDFGAVDECVRGSRTVFVEMCGGHDIKDFDSAFDAKPPVLRRQ